MRLFRVLTLLLLSIGQVPMYAQAGSDSPAIQITELAPLSIAGHRASADQLHWILELQVDASGVKDFKKLMIELVAVASLEPGTLIYEWYFNDDNSYCIINERYRDSAALLVHMQASAAYSERFLAVAKITRLTVLGNPDEPTRVALAGLKANYFAFDAGFFISR